MEDRRKTRRAIDQIRRALQRIEPQLLEISQKLDHVILVLREARHQPDDGGREEAIVEGEEPEE